MKRLGCAAAMGLALGAALMSCQAPIGPPAGSTTRTVSGVVSDFTAGEPGSTFTVRAVRVNADNSLLAGIDDGVLVEVEGAVTDGVLVAASAKKEQVNPGDPLPRLSSEQSARFEAGKAVFARLFAPEDGLGPLFNSEGCGECHESPALGGVGDEVEVHASKFTPPGICDSLVEEGGFVIQQRATPLLQAAGVQKEQIPPHATGQALRTTPPLFGFGLIDSIPDRTVLAHEDPDDVDGDGISGRANRAAGGRPGRFGRKATVAALFDFNSGAFPNEMGITTPLSPAEETINGTPVLPETDPAPDPEVQASDIQAVTDFTGFLAPLARVVPQEVGEARIVRRGEKIFREISCAKCHVPSMRTGKSDVFALSHEAVYLYSDLLLHDMGPDSADICLGVATPSEFRTEMLMGLRFREQFLHDGSARTIQEAIERHAGEADAARNAFAGLSEEDKEALLKFLDTL